MAPLIVPAVTTAISAYSGWRARKNANKLAEQARTPTEQEAGAFEGATGQAGRLGDVGSTLYGQGQQSLGQAGGYYSTLLGKGGRSAMQAAVAPAAENISATYGGAARGIRSSNIRGGARDLALSEMSRAKAGQISRLTAGVQPAAASALTGIGQFQTAMGTGAMGQAGGIYGSLLGPSVTGRGIGVQGAFGADQMKTSAGAAMGPIIMQLLMGLAASRGGGGGGGGYQGLPIGG